MIILWLLAAVLVQKAVEKFATSGQKIHTIAHKADKFLTGVWRAMSDLTDMFGTRLTLEVCGRQCG